MSIAVLAGLAGSQLLRTSRITDRVLAVVVIAGGLLGPELAIACGAAMHDNTPPADWRDALRWLSRETPEPLAPGDFDRFYPRLAEGQTFTYPLSAYGILNWWDYGHWISAIARRIPVSNGMHSGAATAARFFTATDPNEAARIARQIGARYVIADSSLPVPQDSSFRLGGAKFLSMPEWAGLKISDYVANVRGQLPDGSTGTITLFYPAYYRTMLARLYLFDGKAAKPESSSFVVEYREDRSGGKPIKTITSLKDFRTYEEAEAYQRTIGGNSMLVGLYPAKSCVPVEQSEGFSLVYTSQADTSEIDNLHAVKIFAIQR